MSWTAPSRVEWISGAPEHMGMAVFYRQIEELVPWLQIAGCRWRCDVTKEAWNSLQDDSVRGGLQTADICIYGVREYEGANHYYVDLREWCTSIAEDLQLTMKP
ncbi:hypothetical protein PM082_021990 [Marasmius tenuissimus]|nr:hypothetical protein PM082_021990 [Marasmius tenuissimus]